MNSRNNNRSNKRKFFGFNDKNKKNRRPFDNKKLFSDDIKVVSTNINKKSIHKEIQVNDNSKTNNAKDFQNKFYSRDNRAFRINQKKYNRDNKQETKNFSKQQNEKRKNERRIHAKNLLSFYKIEHFERKICSKCNRIINEMHSSIEDPLKKEFYHFDCAYKDLKFKTFLKSSERLVYTGSGTFAVIEDINENGKKKFVIKKNISYVKKS